MTKRAQLILGVVVIAMTWLVLLAVCVRSLGIVVGGVAGIWGVSVPVAALMIATNARADRPTRSQSQPSHTTQPAAA